MSVPEQASAPAVTGFPAAARSEIAGIFPDQLAAAQEILDRAASASVMDILALRGSELIGLADSLRLAAGTAPLGHRVAVRVLLLDPGSAAARRRAGELGEPPGSFDAEIRDTVAQMADLASGLPRLRLELRCYRQLPVWRMIVIDGIQYVSVLCPADPDNPAAIYKLRQVPGGALYQGFQQVFDTLAAAARPVRPAG
jgi:hypothetical protein